MPEIDVTDLAALARRAMLENGFVLDESDAARAELGNLPPLSRLAKGRRDARHLLWSSIDERTSRDLDQLEYAEQLPDGAIRVLVAIADVDAYVAQGSALDAQAAQNSTSVYTGVETFPMLPEELSTDATSLLENAERLALVVELVIEADGQLRYTSVTRAVVKSYAKMNYREVGRWLDEANGAPPDDFARVKGLEAQIKLQWQAAQRLRAWRQKQGALKFQTTEVMPIVESGHIVGLKTTEQNSARSLIENFMIAANTAIADFLEANGAPAILRVVRTPLGWSRMVEIARELGEHLPELPDAPALAAFLERRRAAAPLHFVDLSLAIVKLMGPGEYVVKQPGEAEEGHFALAVRTYTHFTAPNRRYADVVMQRLVKAVRENRAMPYTYEELKAIAERCTMREDAARKVERLLRKAVAAVTLGARIGEEFDAIVTGVKAKGTFARLLRPPVDARIVKNEKGLQVGEQIRVRLLSTDPQHGFIDLARV